MSQYKSILYIAKGSASFSWFIELRSVELNIFILIVEANTTLLRSEYVSAKVT